MLANLSDQEREEILSQPRLNETIEQWLAREDEVMLARYTDRRTTRPRPINGCQPDGDADPKRRMESWLTLPTPMIMRLAIAQDILEQFPPTQAEIDEFRASFEWPKDLPRITVEFGEAKDKK
jgi:hypothetical protein